jgi:hypothetical protein
MRSTSFGLKHFEPGSDSALFPSFNLAETALTNEKKHDIIHALIMMKGALNYG